MSKLTSIYKEQHKPDCRAMRSFRKESWSTPWFISGDAVWADKSGGATGKTYRYLVAKCNDPSCPATSLVEVGQIEEAII